MTKNTENQDEKVSVESVKSGTSFGKIISIYWTCVVLWGIQSEIRCSGYGCYEGLILLPLAAFGMIMTIPYLLIRMFKKWYVCVDKWVQNVYLDLLTAYAQSHVFKVSVCKGVLHEPSWTKQNHSVRSIYVFNVALNEEQLIRFDRNWRFASPFVDDNALQSILSWNSHRFSW